MTNGSATVALSHEFIKFSLEIGVLRFGKFTTKAGRISPYFFNTGLYNDGFKLGSLAHFYARRLIDSKIEFDMLFGPAYKGITLAAAVAVELARIGHNKPFAFNRKEAKDHGEGGSIIGAPVNGRVLIIDDVISAGTSVRESVAIIKASGAKPCGVVIALDRQEKATGPSGDTDYSATQFVTRELGLSVIAIATLADLLDYLKVQGDPALASQFKPVAEYCQRYGAAN